MLDNACYCLLLLLPSSMPLLTNYRIYSVAAVWLPCAHSHSHSRCQDTRPVPQIRGPPASLPVWLCRYDTRTAQTSHSGPRRSPPVRPSVSFSHVRPPVVRSPMVRSPVIRLSVRPSVSPPVSSSQVPTCQTVPQSHAGTGTLVSFTRCRHDGAVRTDSTACCTSARTSGTFTVVPPPSVFPSFASYR